MQLSNRYTEIRRDLRRARRGGVTVRLKDHGNGGTGGSNAAIGKTLLKERKGKKRSKYIS
jgi:hypothetical protein